MTTMLIMAAGIWMVIALVICLALAKAASRKMPLPESADQEMPFVSMARVGAPARAHRGNAVLVGAV